MVRRLLVLGCLWLVTASVLFAETFVPDGMELLKWRKGGWGNPAVFKTVEVPGRGKILQARATDKGKDQHICSLAGTFNAREFPLFTFEINNQFDAQNVPVAIGVTAGKGRGRIYYESSLRWPLPDGHYHRLVYDLSQSNFKRKKYNWIQGVPIDDADSIHSLLILIYPHGKSKAGTTLLDQVRLARGLFVNQQVRKLPFGPNHTSGPILADFNHDGFLDSLLPTDRLLVLPGHARNTVSEPIRVAGLDGRIQAACWTDINRDGFSDIVAALRDPAEVRFLLGDDAGRFIDQTGDWVLPSSSLPAAPQQIVAYDTEPDGDDDLYLGFEDGSWQVWEYQSSHGPRERAPVIVDVEGTLPKPIPWQVANLRRQVVAAGLAGNAPAPAAAGMPRSTASILPGKYMMKAGGEDHPAATCEFIVQRSGQHIILTSKSAFPLYPPHPVTIDGKLSEGEWARAKKLQQTLFYVDSKTKQEEVHSMTLWYRADSYGLYLAAKIEGDDWGDSSNADMFTVYIDKNGNGKIEPGEDSRAFWSDIYNDYYYQLRNGGRRWWERDPLLDGQAAMSHSNRKGIGDYVYEFLIPWDSKDPHDLRVIKDGRIGLKITFVETKHHHYYWYWGRAGRAGFPDADTNRGDTYAKLDIQGLSRRPGSPPGPVAVALTVPKVSRSMKGKVVGKDGSPVVHAIVGLVSSASPSVGQKTLSGQDGRFTLPFEKPPVPVGPRPKIQINGRMVPAPEPEDWVIVAAEGFRQEAFPIEPGKLQYTFTLVKGESLDGLLLDNKGKPLANADLILYFGKLRWSGAQAMSGADGRFHFRNLPKGPFWIWVAQRDRDIFYYAPFEFKSRPVVIDLRPSVHLRGNVTDAITGNPITQFVLREGVFTKAWRKGRIDYWRTLRTGGLQDIRSKDGAFDIRFGPKGSHLYCLTISAKGYPFQVLQQKFKPGDEYLDLPFKLHRGFELSGKVLNWKTDKPVPHAHLTLTKEPGQDDSFASLAPRLTATTDAEGNYQFRALAAGSYYMVAVGKGIIANASYRVRVEPGKDNQMDIHAQPIQQ